MEHRHRVVIIGAGFGGLATARSLAGLAVDVLVVDANNFHTFQPLLYQVATAGLDGDDIAYAVRGMFRRQRNVSVRMGVVDSIDLDGHSLRLTDDTTVPFDSLVIAAGAVSDSFGVPGVAEVALPLKSIDDAEVIRRAVLQQFERACIDPGLVREGSMDVVVCGGGPTGVELAGGLAELYRKVLARDAAHVDVSAARIVLVEAAPRLLAGFSPASSQRARVTLERHGVEVMLGAGVDRVDRDGVDLADGRRLPAPTVVWAAGVRAHPLATKVGTELDARGRLVVEADLSIPGHPDVFAIGDIAASPLPDGSGRPCPQVAQPAIQGGRHVGEQIGRRRRGEATRRFVYVDKGSMATIGRNDAVTELPGGRRFDGFVGWLAWLGLHLIELVGFRNRANVLVNWAWNYLTYDRGARLLSASDRDGSSSGSAASRLS